MKEIKNVEFGGERPLYKSSDLHLDNVTIHVGESSLKECKNIEADNCRFEGKYVFWETRGFNVRNCYFAESARSSLWYSENAELTDCQVDAPKMFRRMKGIKLTNVKFPNGEQTLWDCKDVEIENVVIENADYLFMHTDNIKINNYHQEGNYSFQYSKNVEIHNALINSKDAFWDTENVTIYDSEINGEYLGWYSRNLTLINCKISGTQPLCYCDNLIMKNCTMDADADLAFEYSACDVEVRGKVTSIKNPTSGRIVTDEVGEIILDENIKAPGNCSITVNNK